jgi:hypothetical protein
MTNKEFYRELGNIDPKMIEAAAPAEKVQKKKKNQYSSYLTSLNGLNTMAEVMFALVSQYPFLII